jgi:predicted flap endonuclease-1-like 5' DNA nuclease
MFLFLCKLWPYLAGGLIGWLLAGWFARRLKYTEPPVERVVEKHVDKIVDNPKHLSLISKLETENKKIPDLVTRIAGFESAKPSTKTVEKKVEVDNPAHLKRIKDLEGQLAGLHKATAIDLKAAKAAGLSIKTDTDFTVIEGVGPQINDLLHAGGINTFAELADSDPSRIQKILDAAGPRFKIANPGTWPDQANLVTSNRWPALKALQDVLDGGVYPDTTALKKSAASGSGEATAKPKAAKKVVALDIAAAKAAGFRVKQNNGQDDFTLIEGIGPKINELIHADGIHTFSELSTTYVEVIQKILDKAGARYKLAKPGTWPAQAEMAANNKWDSLKAWQDELDGGEPS